MKTIVPFPLVPFSIFHFSFFNFPFLGVISKCTLFSFLSFRFLCSSAHLSGVETSEISASGVGPFGNRSVPGAESVDNEVISDGTSFHVGINGEPRRIGFMDCRVST